MPRRGLHGDTYADTRVVTAVAAAAAGPRPRETDAVSTSSPPPPSSPSPPPLATYVPFEGRQLLRVAPKARHPQGGGSLWFPLEERNWVGLPSCATAAAAAFVPTRAVIGTSSPDGARRKRRGDALVRREGTSWGEFRFPYLVGHGRRGRSRRRAVSGRNEQTGRQEGGGGVTRNERGGSNEG